MQRFYGTLSAVCLFLALFYGLVPDEPHLPPTHGYLVLIWPCTVYAFYAYCYAYAQIPPGSKDFYM